MEKLRNKFDIVIYSKVFLIIAIGIHLLFLFSLIFGFLNPFFHDSTYRLGQGSDFFAFYQAGYNLLFGLNPYEKYTGYIVVPYSYNYRYLPFFAYTFGILFNLFPPVMAYWIWIILLFALIWYACWITFKICSSLNKPKWVSYIAVGMWLCFSPIYLELYMGQTTLFVGILTFLSFYLEMKNKEKYSTFFWILGSIVKFIPYVLIPSILSSGRTRKVLYNVLITILVILSFGVIYFFFFLDYNLETTGKFYDHNGSFDLKNIIYIIGNLFAPDDNWFLNFNRLINIIMLSTFFGLSTFATIYSRDYLVSLSLFACSFYLAFSGIWEHHYTFLLPFLVILWIREDNRYKWLLIFLLLAIPTPFYLLDSLNLWNFPFSLLYKCSKCIPTLLFFVLLMKEAYINPRDTTFVNSIKEIGNIIYSGLMNPELIDFPSIFFHK